MSAAPTLVEVLARKPAFGSVVRRPDGWVRVSVGQFVLHLDKADYWTLMEMLSDAARRLAGSEPLFGEHQSAC